MTRTIKTNLIRVLSVMVAVCCMFGFLTMPKTSARADGVTTALENYMWVEADAQVNVTSEAKSGVRFIANVNYEFVNGSDENANSLKGIYGNKAKFLFGIVIDDLLYLDENGDVVTRSGDEVTVESKTAIKIAYTEPTSFNGHWTDSVSNYTASVSYREDALRTAFEKHDAEAAPGDKTYFTNGVYNEEEFKVLMSRTYAERLIARAYVQVTKEDGSVDYIYSKSSTVASVRDVANDKYVQNKDDATWLKEYGWLATKYLSTATYKDAFVDVDNGEIFATDLTNYTEFVFGQKALDDGAVVATEASSILSEDVVDAMQLGKTYTLACYDDNGNVLNLNLKAVTEVITTPEEFKSIFNLSTNNTTYRKDMGSFYSCVVDGYFVLGNDLNMADVKLDHNLVCAYDANTTVSAYGVGFYGTFDGNGYTISNLDVSRSVPNYRMTQSGDFMILNKNAEGVATSTTSSYYPSIAANHSCGHSSGTGVGVFASLGYGATIKNVAFTNAKSSNSSFLAMFTEGAATLDGNAEWGTFAGFEEVDAAGYAVRYSKTASGVDISTTCTGGDGCPVHGDEDCTATAGTKYVKCKGNIGCIHCQTMEAHTAKFYPVVLENSYYNVAIREGKIWNRLEKAYGNVAAAKASAGILYENLYIDINDQTTSFRGIFNSFGNAKVDAITTINNVVLNYNGANATAANNGLLRGENKVYNGANTYKDIYFKDTAINNLVIITDKTANLINYNSLNYVASNLEGTKKIEGVLQYTSLEAYKQAIADGEASASTFNKYWNTSAGVPFWSAHYADTITFDVGGVTSDGTESFTIIADGTEQTVKVSALNYFGEALEFETAESSNLDLATVDKTGLITFAKEIESDEATVTITLTIAGKTFTATATMQGGFEIVDASKVVTYSADQGRFNFDGFEADGVVFSNDTVLEASVIYNGVTSTLTKQVIQVKDYGIVNGAHWSENPGYVDASGKDSNVTGDDTMVNFNAFLGENVVKFAVNGEEGNYTPELFTQKLLVKVNIGTEEEPVYKTYLFNNFKAYSAIITNVGQLAEVLSLKTTSTLVKGYYVLANNITSGRGYYKVTQAAPNGKTTMGFQGVFDGQGYFLYSVGNGSNLGLFNQIVSTKEMPTTIRNVSLTTYGGANNFAGFAKSLVADSYETVTAADGAKISVSKYPVEFYNVHYKPTTTSVHGLFYVSPGSVNYKLRNVVINFENLRAIQTYNNSNYFNSDTYGILLNTPEFQYTNGSEKTSVNDFARAAYYAEPFENVVILANMPIVGYIGNDVGSQGYTDKEPLDTYYMGYGANKLGKSGMKIARIAQKSATNYPANQANFVFDVLASQVTLSAAEATPWASAAVTNTYSVTDPADSTVSKTYTTAHEQAFFFKGVYQFYNLAEMKTAIELAESGDTSEESQVLNALVAEGMPYKFSASKTTEGITGRYVQWIQGNN